MASQRLNAGQLAMDGAGAGPSPFGGVGGGNDLGVHGLTLGGGGATAGNGVGGGGGGGGGGLGAGLGGGGTGGPSSLSFDMKVKLVLCQWCAPHGRSAVEGQTSLCWLVCGPWCTTWEVGEAGGLSVARSYGVSCLVLFSE